MYYTNAHLFTTFGEMSIGAITPNAVDKTVMIANALRAPDKTIARGCRIAMIAAMMKVSSPNSATNIIANEDTNAS